MAKRKTPGLGFVPNTQKYVTVSGIRIPRKEWDFLVWAVDYTAEWQGKEYFLTKKESIENLIRELVEERVNVIARDKGKEPVEISDITWTRIKRWFDGTVAKIRVANLLGY